MLSWNSALLLRPEFWHEIIRPLTATSVLKTEFFIHISSGEKGATSVFRVLANHLASFFFLTLSCNSFGLLYWPLWRVSVQPVTECKQLLAFILTWIRYFQLTGRSRSWPAFLIPLLTVNLWGLLIQTWRGWGISYFSPLSGWPRDTLPELP